MENLSPRKKEILNIALELFSENGYDGTSMNDIAVEAGIRKATLYSHFKNKEEIFEIIIDVALKHNLKKKLNAVESTKGLNAVMRLEKIFFKLIEDFTSCNSKAGCWSKFYHFSPDFMKEEILKKAQDLEKTYKAKLQEIVENGIKNGEIRNADSYDIVLTYTYLFTAVLVNFNRNKNMDITGEAKRCISVFLNGIKS